MPLQTRLLVYALNLGLLARTVRLPCHLDRRRYCLCSNNSISAPLTHHSLALLDVDLVTKHDEGEVLRVRWTSLNEELIAPRVERFERLCAVYVVYEHAAIGAAIEGYAQ